MHTCTYSLLIIFFLIGSSEIFAQKSRKVNKNYFSIDLAASGTFSDFDNRQTRWEPKLFPAFTLNLAGNHRLNNRLDLEFGFGGTFYYLIHRGGAERYLLDFAAPHLAAGIGYNFYQTNNKELFVKLRGIIQKGFNGTFRDEFETYTVDISSPANFHYYLGARFGWRTYLKRKAKKKTNLSATEFGANFRYAFKDLGEVVFTENGFQTITSPDGDFAGLYIKMFFAVGSKKVSRKTNNKEEEKIPPPVIYNPRF